MEAEMYVQAAMMASKVVKVTGADKMIEDLVKTHLRNRAKGFFEKQKDKKELELIENKLSEYMIRSYKNHIYMNTIVFGNQQKTIDDLYIPLKVLKKDRILSKGENNCDILINSYKEEFLPNYQKIVLIDNAGMGKSTIAKYLYLSAITENKGIPIFIELRKLSSEEDIIDFIMNEINGISECFDKDKVLKLIERGGFIFFFDGYDEINKANKMKITNSLQNFISKTGNNTFLITSREENELVSFGDFQSFYIKPLKKEEAYNLIKKYSDNDEEVSKMLITKIEEDENFEIIKEFLENPLMVSLLCESFKYKQSIPHKKDAFYRQVYDALFEKHDYSKRAGYYREKKSGLNLEEFHKILRTIGFITLTKGVSYSKEELINIIHNSKRKNIGLEFNENDLVYDLIHNVPIFIKDGIEYRWSHKSFQEYFAACYICYDSDEKSDLLIKISEGDKVRKYYNVLDFCYDIDYKSFAKHIIYPLICKFLNTGHEIDFNRLYSDKYYEGFDREELYLRKSILYNYESLYIYIFNNEETCYYKKSNVEYIEKDRYIEQRVTDCLENEKNINNINARCFISVAPFEDNYAICSNKIYKIGYLDRLLQNKKNPVITYIKLKYNFHEFFVDKLEPGVYFINDNIKNEINKKENFNLFNNLLLNGLTCSYGIYLMFDYDSCIKMKKQIEKEIKEEKSDIDFL
ncbi:TPA: NACHT domain-containing protein [Clostridioides difficile]|uniref:NACHT domain-containing protein n=1 Tax=Clostridioides difficile TaxID=1496 RepID=UPI00097FF65A|nr:NB-ARC domain-containing protein [Clostridioides difficile]SJP64311.1 Predicted NTPase (NACHT family) [Clostridioides difficile]HBG4726924.1 NACHT domain-containing protein [Clostridioides difficile]HBH3594862.1 NACHT domain-containing protein [Clostridioides difficile]HBH3639383.1 NACHT domain-containing protein [Clostridioides difficile]